jgi:hypothetical protein
MADGNGNGNNKTIAALVGVVAALVGGGGWAIKESTASELKYYLLRQEFAEYKASEADRRQAERVRMDTQYWSLMSNLQQIKAEIKRK